MLCRYSLCISICCADIYVVQICMLFRYICWLDILCIVRSADPTVQVFASVQFSSPCRITSRRQTPFWNPPSLPRPTQTPSSARSQHGDAGEISQPLAVGWPKQSRHRQPPGRTGAIAKSHAQPRTKHHSASAQFRLSSTRYAQAQITGNGVCIYSPRS